MDRQSVQIVPCVASDARVHLVQAEIRDVEHRSIARILLDFAKGRVEALNVKDKDFGQFDK